jgi:sigma-B regulation protein RsbU (phosphoserine phosphatase)
MGVQAMTKLKLFHLKNEMLVANFLANLFSVAFVQKLLFRVEPAPEEIWDIPAIGFLDDIFTPLAFTFVIVMTLLYEKPIRAYLNTQFRNKAVSQELEEKARRKVLNEPFVLIALDLSMWLLSATIYPLMFWSFNLGTDLIQRSVFMGLGTGLITVTVAFFLLEHLSQKRLAPYFFPGGGLSLIPKTIRIRIRTRLAALLFACNLIPLLSIIHVFYRINITSSEPLMTIQKLQSVIYTNSIIFIFVGIILTMLVSQNLSNPFKEILKTLRSIKNGHFDKKVQVTSNDEIGYTGDAINEMTEGLKERQRLRKSLDLAMEVQQNLMPKSDPEVLGLDIAGTSIYCEETGGDYYDYLNIGNNGEGKIGVIVGDVSDHGIQSALLMTTARAFLRQRASLSSDLDRIVYDVNKQISHDVEESGRFMTLFFSEIDRQNNKIRWVRAGHDPAILYDPVSTRFKELNGSGLPLGVFDNSVYTQSEHSIRPGQIILIGTDGIWESHNPRGEMFGKARFKDIIKIHADLPAKDIIEKVISALDEFSRPLQKEDDVTLVIVKVQEL